MKKMLKSSSHASVVFNLLKDLADKKGFACSFDDLFYHSIKTCLGEKSIGDILKTEYTNGYCYFYALLLAKGLNDCELKNGVLHRLDFSVMDAYYEEFGHSWVERNGLVYDTTARKIFLKEYYYKVFEVEVRETYLSSELESTELFFKLGLNAVKKTPEMISKLLDDKAIQELGSDRIEGYISEVPNNNTKRRLERLYENNYLQKDTLNINAETEKNRSLV